MKAEERQVNDDDAGDPARSVWGGRVLVSALLCLIVLNLVWMVRNCEGPRQATRGQAAPDFTVAQVDGGKFHLLEAPGHPVLVDFWATWCIPCRESLPILDRVYERYKGRGLRAVAIETEGAAQKAQAFAGQLGLHMPIGLEHGEVSALYDVSTIPHLVLIDGQGNVRRVFHGVHSAAELSRAVEEVGLPGK